jgi:ABC-type glycerol-3-phosphate transport system permease component
MSLKRRFTAADGVLIALLSLAGFLSLLPIINTLATSFSAPAAADGGFVGLWPVGFTVMSYQKVMTDPLYYRSVIVSVERVILGVSIGITVQVLLAFPLSREPRRFKGRTIYMWIVIFTMLFSGGLVPTYILITKYYRLQDTLWALVLPAALNQFNVILLMNFFRGVPKELEEAARIDGAGPWYVLTRVYVPLSIPAIATIILFNFLFHWNSFFDGLIYMNKSWNYPLASYIQQVVVRVSAQRLSREELLAAAKLSSKTLNAAKVFIALVPIMMVYPFIQRFFVRGITLGALKE